VTLVLTFMSHDYALHVADTRLCTRTASGVWEPVSEDAVKLEQIGGTLLIGFAGMASFARIPTIDWLKSRFTKAVRDLDPALRALAAELTGRFERRQHLDQVLTVTIAGWVANEKAELVSIVASLTNQDPVTFERYPAFKFGWKEIPTAGGWVATGQIDKQRAARLNAYLARLLMNPVTPDKIVNAFLRTIRAEADDNVAVGHRARVGSLPRAALERATRLGEDFVVWPTNKPYMSAEIPMEIEVAADQAAIRLVPLSSFDFSEARIIDE
jgi:hypothetical protein